MNQHSAAHSQYVFVENACFERIPECAALNGGVVGFLASGEADFGSGFPHPRLALPVEFIRGSESRLRISSPDVVRHGIPLSNDAGVPADVLASLLSFYVQARRSFDLTCKQMGRELGQLPLRAHNFVITQDGAALHGLGLIAVTRADLKRLLAVTLYWVRPWRWGETSISSEREIVEDICRIGRDAFIASNVSHPLGEVLEQPPRDLRLLATALAPWVAPVGTFRAYAQSAAAMNVRNDDEADEETVEGVTKLIPQPAGRDPDDEETTVAPDGYQRQFSALNDV